VTPTIRPRPDAIIAESFRKTVERPVVGQDRDRDVEMTGLVTSSSAQNGQAFTVPDTAMVPSTSAAALQA